MNPRDKRMMERRFDIQARQLGEENAPELWVEGRAIVYDSPTVLFEWDGNEYSEQISREALQNCNMSDVIFNYNHGGRVMARTRNGTLTLEDRPDGLYVRARLDGTEQGRQIYGEIQGGYVDKMSFRFSVDEDSYNESTRTWTVRAIKRLYDVSVVDIPAYSDTYIEARRACAEQMALESRRDAAAAAALRQRVIIKSKF